MMISNKAYYSDPYLNYSKLMIIKLGYLSPYSNFNFKRISQSYFFFDYKLRKTICVRILASERN